MKGERNGEDRTRACLHPATIMMEGGRNGEDRTRACLHPATIMMEGGRNGEDRTRAEKTMESRGGEEKHNGIVL